MDVESDDDKPDLAESGEEDDPVPARHGSSPTELRARSAPEVPDPTELRARSVPEAPDPVELRASPPGGGTSFITTAVNEEAAERSAFFADRFGDKPKKKTFKKKPPVKDGDKNLRFWAGCAKARRSTSGGLVMRGSHLLAHGRARKPR